MSFAFDPSKPTGERIPAEVVKIGDEYLQKDQKYRLAIKHYLHSGNDGFTMLPQCPILVKKINYYYFFKLFFVYDSYLNDLL